jgi:hypothetical protein
MTATRLLFLLAAGVMALVTACGGGSTAARPPASHGGDGDNDNFGGPSDGDGNV